VAKAIVKAKDPYRFNASTWKTKAEWKKWERVGMQKTLQLNKMNLIWVDRTVADLEITGAIEAIQMDRTIEGASTLEITLRDPHRHLFSRVLGRSVERNRPTMQSKRSVPVDEGWQVIHQTDIIERAVDIEIDGVYFRLVKVNINWGISQYILTFEDRIINRLRKKKGALSASRAQVTRAEFILRLLREVRAEKTPFVCPELHQKQIIAKGKDVGAQPDPDIGQSGFSTGKHFTVQGQKATIGQRRNMGKVIESAQGVPGASKKAIKAVVEAVIVESRVRNLPDGDKDSRGILQVRDSTASPRHLDNRDIDACVREFMENGFWGKGGAIQIAKHNPSKDAGWVAQQTQGSAFPDRYSKWSDEAEKWLEGYASGAGAGAGTYVKSYQYQRDAKEDSWTCMQRLADEVNWRLFVVGKVMYFMSEDDLYRRRIRHLITPDDSDFIDFQGDVDWGKPVNEMTVQVTAGRWDAPPGCVIEFDGFNVIDGRWLVSASTRDWFSPVIELTLKQPGNPDREPAADRATRASRASEGGGGGLSLGKSGDYYHYAQLVSKNTQSYHLGGGHGPLASFNSGTNFDCSGSTSWVAWKAGMWEKTGPYAGVARTSGQFDSWGEAGRGERITVWYNAGHVFTIFEPGADVGHKRFDTGGPGGGSGARIRDKWRSTNGFQPRHWPGT
jgi:hypothetical protein